MASKQEMPDLIKTIRAILVSRKGKTIERDLMRDYQEINGERIPYKKYGFSNLETFLLRAGEFIIERDNNGLIVSAIPTKETSHITAMVQKQKTTKKRKMTLQQRVPRSCDQSWQKTQYSTSFKNYTPRKSFPIDNRRKTVNFNNNSNVRNRNSVYTAQKNTIQITTTNNISKPQNLINVGANLVFPSSIPNQDVRSKISQKINDDIDVFPNIPLYDIPNQDVRSKFLQKNSVNQISNNKTSNSYTNSKENVIENSNNTIQNRLRITNTDKHSISPIIIPSPPVSPEMSPQTPKSDKSLNLKKFPEISNTIPNVISSITNSKQPLSRLSIQERLKIIQQAPPPAKDTKIVSNEVISSVIEEKQKTPPKLPEKIRNVTLVNMTPCEELIYFCEVRNLLIPVFKTYIIKNSKRVQCKVTVDSSTYSTYPEDFLTEYEAKSAAARAALDSLKKEEMRNLYPVCLDPDYMIAMKMLDCLKEYTNGVFSDKFPDIFQKSYEQTLPEHWLQIMGSSSQFFTLEETAQDNVIIFASQQNPGSSTPSSISDADSSFIDKIVLPWNEEHWNFYVTNPVSTVEIWARIIGTEYHDKMESLTTDIEMAMLTEKQRAQTIQMNCIYLVSFADSWSRVRIREIDFEQNRCLCFFIDSGDEEWFAMETLYICENRFLKLPSQAIILSLFGLEDFDENPNAKNQLVELLAGKSLVGKILTKQEEFDRDDESANIEPRVKVVLYDTSSEEDLNLNPLILQKICENTPVPQIERTNVTHVNVTHISDSGDIYCQVKNSGIYYIEKLIHNIIKSKLNEEIHQGLYKNTNETNQYYLYLDEKDNKWYRVMIEPCKGNVDNNYKLFYIDYGITKYVNTTRLLRTDSLSAALHRFPAQAIKVKLFDVQLTNDSITRLRGLLKQDTPTILKMLVYATIPLVNLYIRIIANGILVNVNDTIRMEQEIEETSEEINSKSYRNTSQISSNSASSSPRSNSTKSLNSPTNSEACSLINDISNQFKNIEIKTSSPIKSASAVTTQLELPKLTDYKIPKVDSVFEIHVTMASNPNYFFVQPHSDAPKLYTLMANLQNYCINNNEFIPNDMVQTGEYYAALHADGHWYRAKVENVFSASMIHICYSDYGDVAVVASDKLKLLPNEFRLLPKQAIKAKLHGIKPKHGDWAMEDCLHFQKLAVNNIFSSIIKAINIDEMDDNNIIELILFDVSGDVDVIINKSFIEDGRAVSI